MRGRNFSTRQREREGGSFNVQSYVEAFKIATVARWMADKGVLARRQSGAVMKECLDMVYEYVMRETGDGGFTSASEAVNWLANEGFSIAQLNLQGRRGVMRDLVKEALEQDFAPVRGTRNQGYYPKTTADDIPGVEEMQHLLDKVMEQQQRGVDGSVPVGGLALAEE